LGLIVPQRLFMYQHNGQDSGYVNSTISRFIPDLVHHTFQRKYWDDSRGQPPLGQTKWRSKRIDVATIAEAMWCLKKRGEGQ
jgi:hypothetical protein